MIIVCSRLPEKSKSSRIRPQVPWYKISFIHRKAGFFPTNTLLALLRCSPEMSRFWRRKVILWYVDHWLSLKPTGGWILSGFQGSCCLSSFVNVIYQHKGGQLSTLWYTEKKSDSVTAKLIFIQNYFESELNFKSLGRAFSQLDKCAKWSRHSFAGWNERQKIFHRFQRTFLVEQRARAASTNSLAAITCLLTQTIPWRQNVSSCGNLYLATAVNRIMLFWKSAKKTPRVWRQAIIVPWKF